MFGTIGEWTEAKLARYVQNILRSSPAQLPRALQLEEVRATKKLIVEDELELSPQAIQYLQDKLGL